MRTAGFQRLEDFSPGAPVFHVGIAKFDPDRGVVDADIRYRGEGFWDGLRLPTRVTLRYHGDVQRGKRGWVAGAHPSNFRDVRVLSADGEEKPLEWEYWSPFLRNAAEAVGDQLDKNYPIYSKSFYDNYNPQDPLDWYKTASRQAANPRVAWAYHVTLLKNLSGIQEEGLVPNRNPNWGEDELLSNNSRLGNFFTLDPRLARSWFDTLMNNAFADRDFHMGGVRRWKKVTWRVFEQVFPVILRFKINLNKTRKDPLLDSYQPGYYVPRRITPEGIEMWTGNHWVKGLDPEKLNWRKFAEGDTEKKTVNRELPVRIKDTSEIRKHRGFPPGKDFQVAPSSRKTVGSKNSPLAIDDCPTEETPASDGRMHCEKDLRPWFDKQIVGSKRMTPDQFENELVLISHHVNDIQEGLKDGDLDYARKGLADIRESLDRLEKFLPSSMREEFSRISSLSRRVAVRIRNFGL